MDEPNIINDKEYTFYSIVDGPHWENWCGHDVNDYVATVWVDEKEIIDIYMVNGLRGQSPCLRCGPEPNDYYSPESVADIIRRAYTDEMNRCVYKALEYKGYFAWVKKKA